MQIQRELINKIVKERKSNRIRQWHIADHLGISLTSYANIEKCKAKLSIDNAEKILSLLDIDFLIGLGGLVEKDCEEIELYDIRLMREKKKISQAELAEGIGYTKQHYSAMENGRSNLTINTYNKIIKFIREFTNEAKKEKYLEELKRDEEMYKVQ